MTTIAINGGSMHMPNTFAVYMYSPFPVIVESASLSDVSLHVTCRDTGLRHSETRALFDGRAEFDLARIVQLLAPDVDGVFGMNLTLDGEASPYVELEFELDAPSGAVLITRELLGLYGTQDQLDERFGPQRRRVWVNYPQTLQIWKDSADEMRITGDFGDFYPPINATGSTAMVEMNLPLHWDYFGGEELRDALKAGKTTNVDVSCVFGGLDTVKDQDFYSLVLVPDLTPLGAGTYLRWLHRDGTFGYWCFRNGALRTDAAQRSVFLRHVEGNPSEAVGDRYRNGVKQDFRATRQLSLGAKCETLEEFEYLCGLATSPVVDRMVILPDGDIRWQRVNVVPGSYARDVTYNTPSLQDFEITIELPERNTVTL